MPAGAGWLACFQSLPRVRRLVDHVLAMFDVRRFSIFLPRTVWYCGRLAVRSATCLPIR